VVVVVVVALAYLGIDQVETSAQQLAGAGESDQDVLAPGADSSLYAGTLLRASGNAPSNCPLW